jgi:hypothetical protein
VGVRIGHHKIVGVRVLAETGDFREGFAGGIQAVQRHHKRPFGTGRAVMHGDPELIDDKSDIGLGRCAGGQHRR